MNVRTVSIGKVALDPANVRTHDERNLKAIQDSLRVFGQRKPIVVMKADDGFVVIAGNGTLEAAREIGWDSIAVTVVPEEWTSDEAAAYAIADNRTAELAAWDQVGLDMQLAELEAAGWEPELLGFDGKGGLGADEVVEDEVPEPPADPVTKPGDLWLLGEHRLLCGDSCERETYTRLLDGAVPSLMVTDPPYGVAYQDRQGGAIHGDLTQATIPVFLSCALDVLDHNARVYLFGGSDNWSMYQKLYEHHLRMTPKPIVWVKESFILRHNGYHSQFELVFYGWKGKGGGLDYWYGDRKGSDVWEVARDVTSERVHPTQKPVEVCAIPIQNSSKAGEGVLEPFCGSGSTLIACEQLGRVCYAIEMDPRFCDVIVKRWENLTGVKATLADG